MTVRLHDPRPRARVSPWRLALATAATLLALWISHEDPTSNHPHQPRPPHHRRKHPAMTTYEVRITVTDRNPGRSRANTRATLVEILTRTEELHTAGYSLHHAPEVAEVVDAAPTLAQLLGVDTPPENDTRPPFPITPGSDECPACHRPGTLQAAEETTRYWRGFTIAADGTVQVYDDTTADDGDDARIDCIACGASWELPAAIEYG